MYTQIEIVPLFEKGDMVECIYDNHLNNIKRGDVLEVTDTEFSGGEQWLHFRITEGVTTIVQAKHFKIAESAVLSYDTKVI